jgi:hypothetical protein
VSTYCFDLKDGTTKELSAINFIQAILVIKGKGCPEDQIQKIRIKQPGDTKITSPQQLSR